MQYNRYTQTSAPSLYNPMSLQELAFAPSFLRQRHDETNAATAQLVQQLGDYNVLDQYQDTARQFIDPLEQEIGTMAEQLATKGITESNAVSNLMGLSAKKQKLYGPSGEVGQLQARSKQYQDTVAEIKKQFEDEPLIANHMIGRLNAGQAQIDPDTKKLTLGQFQSPSYTRHIPQAEILDRLNTAVSSLDEETLSGIGLSGVGKLGNFNDLYRVAQQQGVSFDRVNDLITNMIAPEEVASIAQYGQALGISPQEAIQQFRGQIKGIANARAYTKETDQFFNVSNELSLYAAKKRMDEKSEKPLIPFLAPSGRISSKSINPYANMKIGENNKLQIDSNSHRLDPEYWRYSGYNVRSKPNGEFEVTTSGIGGNVPVFSSENAKQVLKDAKVISESFEQVKNSNSELRNLSPEQALEKIEKYHENITQRYGTSFKGSLDNKALAANVISYAPNASVFGPEGTAGKLELALESLGFSSYADFRENGHDTFAGLNLFGPSGKPTYEFTVEGSDGEKTSMFIEADLGTQQVAQRSSAINNLVLNGALSSDTFSQGQRFTKTGQAINTMEIDVNPVGTSSEPYKLEIVNINIPDGSGNVQEQLKQDIAGKSPAELERILSSKYKLKSNQDYLITPLNKIIENETQQILKLQEQYNKQ